jgi:outer membrane immunogenic protein
MAMNRPGRLLSFAAAALTSTGIAAQPTFAADLAPVSRTLPPIAMVNWTGFYVGGDIAGVFTTAAYSRPFGGLADTSIGTIDQRPAYGVYGGFNYQISPWAVIGIEGNSKWLSGATYRELGPALDFLMQSRNVTSVAGRVGVLLRPDTMIYGKVGPAWIETEGFQGFGDTFRQTLSGLQAGVGVETLITPNWALRAEASYTYANQVLSLNQGFDLYRPAFVMLDVGLAYKFDAPAGWGVPAATTVSAAPARMLYKAPPTAGVPLTPKWTGFEVGGFVSANGSKVTYNDALLGELGPYTDLTFGGGWFAGANYQFQRVVVGIEASGNYEDANFYTAAGSGGLVTNFHNFAKIDRILALTGRAGWLATPNTLFYVKAGYAELRMTPNAQYFNSIAPNSTPATTFPGYQAGIGAETYVTQNISVRVEGTYTHTGRNVVLNGTVPSEFTLQPSVLSTTLGTAFHF